MKKVIFSLLSFTVLTVNAQKKMPIKKTVNKTVTKTNNSIKAKKSDTVIAPKIYSYNELSKKPVCDSFGSLLLNKFGNSYWYEYVMRHRDVIPIYYNTPIGLKFKIILQVNKDGSIGNVSIEDMNGVYYYTEDYSELKNFISTIKWVPGEMYGYAVNSWCSIDISFDVYEPKKEVINQVQNEVRKDVYYPNKYTILVTTDFGKIISGVSFMYKVRENGSLIFMHTSGRMIKVENDDIRDDKQREYQVNAIGYSIDCNFGSHINHKRYSSMRYYGVVGYISAIPESDVLMWMVDSPSIDYQKDFALIPNQTEMKAILRQIKTYSSLLEGFNLKLDRVDKKIQEKEVEIYEFPFEKQISFAIALCITDLSKKLGHIYDSIQKGETQWVEFWELVKATSICIQQNQSFDVEDKMSKWVIGKQRNKKIEEIFEEI